MDTDEPGLQRGGVERVRIEARQGVRERFQNAQHGVVVARTRIERRGVGSEQLDTAVLRALLENGQATVGGDGEGRLGPELQNGKPGARLGVKR